MNERKQGVFKVSDEIKSVSTADGYISSLDERLQKWASSANFIKKYYGKVISVEDDQTYATIVLVTDDTEMTFLNKTGEMLSVGDYVKVECSNENLTGGYISEKFGSSHIENLNDLLTSESSLVSSINSIATYVNDNKKKLLAAAITQKGVQTSYTDSFETMAENIRKIEGSTPIVVLGNFIVFYSTDYFSVYLYSQKGTPSWDGTMEYSINGTAWFTWDGGTVLSSSKSEGKHFLYFRGTGNTIIRDPNGWTSYFDSYFALNSSYATVFCKGNVENLLDWRTVAKGGHPTMGKGAFCDVFNRSDITYVLSFSALTLTTYCYGWAILTSYSMSQSSTYKYPFRIPTSGTATEVTDWKRGSSNIPPLNTTVYLKYNPYAIE